MPAARAAIVGNSQLKAHISAPNAGEISGYMPARASVSLRIKKADASVRKLKENTEKFLA